MLARFAHIVARRRRWIIGAWIVLTLFGAFSASQVSKRWYQSFSIPGKPAYEANQRTLEKFGTGVRPPTVVVAHDPNGDVTKDVAIAQAFARAARTQKGARTSSWFSTHNAMYVSRDRHTTFLELYPAGVATFSSTSGAETIRKAALRDLPSGIDLQVTGHDPLEEASQHGGGARATSCSRPWSAASGR